MNKSDPKPAQPETELPARSNVAPKLSASSVAGNETRNRVTLRTLAQKLNLSVTTVSRALKKGHDVNSATIEKVESAAKLLGYRPHLGGINLRTGRSHAIGIFLPLERPGEINNFLPSLMEGVSAHLKTAGYRTTIVPVLRKDDPMEALKDLVDERWVDGIVLKNTTPQDNRVKYLLEIGFPFITFGRTELFSPHPYVDIDHENIGAAAANILLEAGHENPVLVAPPADSTYSLQFVKGWRDSFAVRKKSCPETSILYAAPTPNRGLEIVDELFLKNPRTTGAFVASEEATLGLVVGLRARSMRVGREFGLLTYGGSQLHQFLNPPISAFIYSHFNTGVRLAEFLIRSIEGEGPALLRQIDQAAFVDFKSQYLR